MRARFGARQPSREFDGAGDMLGYGWRELKEFAARAFEREAMFVCAAGRIWPKRRDANAFGTLDGLRVPLARRAVSFRRKPALDVPAIHRGIFRFFSKFNALSQQDAILVAVLEFATNPGETVP